ncbi:uncharacterized protein LOC135351832 isoform X3 [Halichondria panicea]|uniref:uncharacterized protein LOC135351832 isoform X3 n=1 Tax=Halichondria panicea TaxID=6063 RepID=UPI00312B7627
MSTDSQLYTDLKGILENARSAGISETEIQGCLEKEGLLPSPAQIMQKAWRILDILTFKVYPLLFLLSLLAYPTFKAFTGSPCLVSEVFPLAEAVTPFVDCKICKGVTHAPRLSNLSQEDFIRNYAYQSKPILVVGAASDWPALDLFSYDYFKDLYLSRPAALEGDNEQGQFFAYSSSINDLSDLFALPSEVASMSKEKWYIGWSSSEPNIGEEMRKHIRSPYFIPPTLNNGDLAWIFMGAPGPGASIHVDMVELSSWQAQLSGTKVWTLTPPPECEHVCQAFNITVNKGDIIVVDTNRWYHQTTVLPGNISITIGSEYN